MSKGPSSQQLSKSAKRLLLTFGKSVDSAPSGLAGVSDAQEKHLEELIANDLVTRSEHGGCALTAAGRAHLARSALKHSASGVDPFLGQHLSLEQREVVLPQGRAGVTVNDAESPLAWLARRKGRDGRPLIEPVHLQAGERLRADFTRAQLMPRTTSNWNAPIARDGRTSNTSATFTETMIAARQRVRHALEAVGPEFAGLLLDLCCFLKGLEEIEHARGWPSRSAKVVLQLGLERLARHYGLRNEAHGPAHAAVRTWLAPDATFQVALETGG
jgi:hypothetical protein